VERETNMDRTDMGGGGGGKGSPGTWGLEKRVGAVSLTAPKVMFYILSRILLPPLFFNIFEVASSMYIQLFSLPPTPPSATF